MNDTDKAAMLSDITDLQNQIKNIEFDKHIFETDYRTFKSVEFEQLKSNVTLNMSMVHVLQTDQERLLGVAKDPDGNNILTFEKGEIIVRDASGELVVKINNDITIGELYKDSPISAVREFMHAMMAYKALVSD